MNSDLCARSHTHTHPLTGFLTCTHLDDWTLQLICSSPRRYCLQLKHTHTCQINFKANVHRSISYCRDFRTSASSWTVEFTVWKQHPEGPSCRLRLCAIHSSPEFPPAFPFSCYQQKRSGGMSLTPPAKALQNCFFQLSNLSTNQPTLYRLIDSSFPVWRVCRQEKKANAWQRYDEAIVTTAVGLQI